MTSTLNWDIGWVNKYFKINLDPAGSNMVFYIPQGQLSMYATDNSNQYINVDVRNTGLTLNWELNSNLAPSASAEDLMDKIVALSTA